MYKEKYSKITLLIEKKLFTEKKDPVIEQQFEKVNKKPF